MDQRTMRKAIRHELRFGAASASARWALGCVGVAFMVRLLLYSLLGNQDGHYGNPRLLRRLRQENGQPGAANQASRSRNGNEIWYDVVYSYRVWRQRFAAAMTDA